MQAAKLQKGEAASARSGPAADIWRPLSTEKVRRRQIIWVIKLHLQPQLSIATSNTASWPLIPSFEMLYSQPLPIAVVARPLVQCAAWVLS